MSDLVTRSQLQILADTLGVDVSEIASLERLGAEAIGALCERTSNVIFDDLAAVFARVSKLAPLVPNALVAKTAQAVVTPLVAGRAAGALGVDHPDRITDVLSRISPSYMADCAPFLDPRMVAVLAPKIEAQLLIPAANVLMERREYLVASRFVEHATPELIVAFEEALDDDEGILNTAALIPSASRLSEIVRLLRGDRLNQIVRDAATIPERTLVGLSVLARLEPDLQAELAELLVDALDNAGLERILRLALDNDALSELLSVVSQLPTTALPRFAELDGMADTATMKRLARAAEESGQVDTLVRMVQSVPGPMAEQALAILGR